MLDVLDSVTAPRREEPILHPSLRGEPLGELRGDKRGEERGDVRERVVFPDRSAKVITVLGWAVAIAKLQCTYTAAASGKLQREIINKHCHSETASVI